MKHLVRTIDQNSHSPRRRSLTSLAALSPSARSVLSIILLRSTAALSSPLIVHPMFIVGELEQRQPNFSSKSTAYRRASFHSLAKFTPKKKKQAQRNDRIFRGVFYPRHMCRNASRLRHEAFFLHINAPVNFAFVARTNQNHARTRAYPCARIDFGKDNPGCKIQVFFFFLQCESWLCFT